MGELDWHPESYVAEIREVIPRYDELQDQVAAATRALDVDEALELGTGTGETARRILALHAEAHFVAVDGNAEMLRWAGDALPQDRVDLKLMRLEDAPPAGRFALVFSVLAVHHLPSVEKAALFSRIAAALRPGGRFVLGDVVVPASPADAFIPLEEGVDLPDRVEDQIEWLKNAGLVPEVAWAWKDLAVLTADAPS